VYCAFHFRFYECAVAGHNLCLEDGIPLGAGAHQFLSGSFQIVTICIQLPVAATALIGTL
jgi:hypothetical protein